MQFRAGKITRAMTCDVLYGVADDGTVKPRRQRVDLRRRCASGVHHHPSSSSATARRGSARSRPQLLPLWLTNPERVWDPRELAGYGLGQSRAPPNRARRTSTPTRDTCCSGSRSSAPPAARRRSSSSSTWSIRSTSSATQLPSPRAVKPAEEGPVLSGYQSLPIEGGLDCANPLDITELSASVGFTDAGVVSTIADLGRYGQALATGALLADGVDRFDHPLAAYAEGSRLVHRHRRSRHRRIPHRSVRRRPRLPDRRSSPTPTPGSPSPSCSTTRPQAPPWRHTSRGSSPRSHRRRPPAAGETAPEAGLPWTAQQYHDAIAAAARLPAPGPVTAGP